MDIDIQADTAWHLGADLWLPRNLDERDQCSVPLQHSNQPKTHCRLSRSNKVDGPLEIFAGISLSCWRLEEIFGPEGLRQVLTD